MNLMTKLREISAFLILLIAFLQVGCSSKEKSDETESAITKMAEQDPSLKRYGKRPGLRDDLRFDSTKYPEGIILARLNWPNGSIRRMVVRPDSSDKASSIVAEWDKDGFLVRTQELSGRLPNGTTTAWHKSGSLESLAKYDKGKLTDTLYMFWTDGLPKQVETYVDGKKNGIWYKYDEDGDLIKQGYFTDDSLSGEFTEWDEDGNVKYKGEYLDNKMTGEWKKYYPNGELRALAEYKEGKREGKNIVWDGTGAVMSVQFFVDDTIVPWPDSLEAPEDRSTPVPVILKRPGQFIKDSVK